MTIGLQSPVRVSGLETLKALHRCDAAPCASPYPALQPKFGLRRAWRSGVLCTPGRTARGSPGGRLVLETIATTQELVAIGWEYLATTSSYLTSREAAAAGRQEGAFRIRIDYRFVCPQLEIHPLRFCYLTQRNDDDSICSYGNRPNRGLSFTSEKRIVGTVIR